ncbi:sensor domain-containing diguanylate cyclase [Oleomonas cavernae]|uniref:diguanylate cyclase n=1 Tax=Oleomonas cavernae TaxID=2320859 RepID=A0A418W9Z0_9PROT|nr:sensor domain-containing diguanylate cyclase [Oleomonas cavernae]RJF86851.1 sensor domain-containing diguanylate cyclase [Oleomonas cavernae]
MPDLSLPGPDPGMLALEKEVARLNKMVRALMDRAERSTSVQASDFSLFQTAILLEEQVRKRTAEVEAALRENEKITRALRESEAKFRGLVTQSMVGIVTIEDGKFTYANAKFEAIFGYSAEELRGMGAIDLTVEEDRPLVAENLRKRLSGEVDQAHYVFHGRRKDGIVLDIEIQGGVMELAGKRVLLSLVMDVTERARAEREVQALQERLREQSTHDALTGLYNRRYLDDTLARELTLAQRHGHEVSVILGDLDHFKSVNDRFGHLAGDEVLRAFGELMKGHARSSDIYCRYGGEEFLLVLPRVTTAIAIERTEQLRRSLAATPIPFDKVLIPVTASFGIATFPRDGQTADALIAAADKALYGAKAAGRNRVHASSTDARPPHGTGLRAAAPVC